MDTKIDDEVSELAGLRLSSVFVLLRSRVMHTAACEKRMKFGRLQGRGLGELSVLLVF